MRMVGKDQFQSDLSEMLKELGNLVALESPTHEKQAVDRLGEYIIDKLRSLGVEVKVQSQGKYGNHVIGQWQKDESQAGFLTLCHMDTVFPLGTISQRPCIEQEGKLFGPGALDMKAGIVILLTCMQKMLANDLFPDRSLTMLFTSDEEVGSPSSRKLVENLACHSSLVLCMEPGMPDGSLKTWRKGVGSFEIIVRGRAAHAGSDHKKGRNAIEELAHQVLAIQRLTDYQKQTTLSVGIIEGGTASNVVPDFARAKVDIRVLDPFEAERMTRRMKELAPVLDGTSIEVQGGLNRPPMPYDDRMKDTFTKAQAIANQAGISIGAGGTGGGSDANFVAALGIPVLDGLGATGNGMHSKEEYVLINSLPERAALLSALLLNW